MDGSTARPARGAALAAAALLGLVAAGPQAQAQLDPHQHHQHHQWMAPAAGGHLHDLGPAGSTYDLRWIDGMLQHHSGALRMSEVVFDIGVPGVGSLGQRIWRDQAQEIKALGQWRRAWYPEAPGHPVVLKPGGDPDAMGDLAAMGAAQIRAMQMAKAQPTRQNRVTWFLEGMLEHHGGALVMAHDALDKSSNPTIRRLARSIIVAQRQEILEIRRMLRHDGLNKPWYHRYDGLFTLP